MDIYGVLRQLSLWTFMVYCCIETASNQYVWNGLRVGKQRLREAGIQFVDYLILLLAGVCLGTLAKFSDESFGAAGYTYTVIAVCKST